MKNQKRVVQKLETNNDFNTNFHRKNPLFSEVESTLALLRFTSIVVENSTCKSQFHKSELRRVKRCCDSSQAGLKLFYPRV
ncbi:hypothetical protein [Rummeliibacillus pycnus]|uniref:hypothetical protein n=1 Tax=Rummeliibacillus pycnus TaxID=101070 RepID=UPI003D2A7BDA